MLTVILKTGFIKADLLRRIRIIREFTEQRFFASDGEKGKKDLEEFLSKDEFSDDDRKIIKGYGQEFFRSYTKENAYDFLEEIEKGVKKLETINVYVPMELDAASVEKLGMWVRDSIGQNILIELHIDVTAVGGCAFARGGAYHDFSLHHAFTTHGKEIKGILDNYIKNTQGSQQSS